MKALYSLIGLPVMEIETSLQVGEVKDIVLNLEKVTVCGILVSPTGWLNDCAYISFASIYNMGRDAVMIRNKAVLEEFSVASSDNCYLTSLCTKQIFTETGLQLGVLTDICFDQSTGELKAYLLSDGIITDLLYGRMAMPIPQVQVIGQERLIVPESMSDLVQSEVRKLGEV